MPNRYYHFTGRSDDIINSILSLLVGKEHYGEISYYCNFLNDTQPGGYRKKLGNILSLMQKENLILIRENPDELEAIAKDGEEPAIKNNTIPLSKMARIYIRQHGKQVLSEGGFKSQAGKKNTNIESTGLSFSSNLTIFVLLLAGVLSIHSMF